MTGGFFVVGVSACHFLKRTTEIEFFRRSMRIGVVTALVGSSSSMNQGFAQFGELKMYQPDKLDESVVGMPLGAMIGLGFLCSSARSSARCAGPRTGSRRRGSCTT